MENKHLKESQSIKRWLEQFQETGSVLHKKGAWGDWTLLLSRPWTVQILSICLSHLQSSRWHTFNQTSSSNKMVPLHTGALQWKNLWTKLFQTDGLGGTDKSLGPSLPQCNPTGFYLLELCKGQEFRPKVGSVVELPARINNAVASVTPQMLENTWREIEYRLGILRATNGAHIEMYWTWWVVPSSKANQFSVSRILCALCVLEMWCINCGKPVHQIIYPT
jgi:hypothetical protein